ncbi:MAG: glycosyltransferase, partial [Acetobacteraceae bacterium]|nr:glycosyltransferase [Acetobacteraceae bacterium]
SLIDAADAYVSLHRSEGLGLTMAEAMLLGKPVIATGYSGNMDFMDESNSLLVDYKLVRLTREIPPYEAYCRWAEPDIDHAARLMRRIYENRDWARDLGTKARADARTLLSLDTAGQRMAHRLADIQSARANRSQPTGAARPAGRALSTTL